MGLTRRDRRRRRVVRQPFVLSNFLGWNDDNNNAALHDLELRAAKNILFYRERLVGGRFGYYRGRFGYYRDPFSAAIGGGAPITGIVDWHPDRDSNPRPIFTAGTVLAEDDGDGTPTARTGTATITTGANNVFTFAVMKSDLIGTCGTGVPFELGSAGNAANLTGWFSNARTCKYLHSQFGFVFAAGFTGTGDTGSSEGASQHPMGVQHCMLQDHNTWLEGNVVDKIGGFASFGDEYITGLFRHRDYLMIGTNRRIYPVVFTGDVFSTFQVQRPLEVGLAHQRAVVSINGEFTFFMSPDGHVHAIREVAGSFGDISVGTALTSKIQNYVSTLNRTRVQYSHGVYWKEHGLVLFSVSQGVNQGSHNEIIALDVNNFPLDDPDHRAARWIRWTNINANAMAILKRNTQAASQSTPQADGYEHLVIGTTTGWAKRMTETISYDEQDDGTKDDIQTELSTKYWDFGEPTDRKSVVEGYFDMEPSTEDDGPTADIQYDYGVKSSRARQINMTGNIGEGDVWDSTFVWDVSRWSSTNQITRNRIRFINGGTNASLRLRQRLNGTMQWKMQSATLILELRGVSPENP
jgi:hypothetical protein